MFTGQDAVHSPNSCKLVKTLYGSQQSHSCRHGRLLIASSHKSTWTEFILPGSEALRLFLPLCFAARDVPWLDLERELPQRLLCEMVTEVVEEGYDVIVVFEIVMSRRGKVYRGLIWDVQHEERNVHTRDVKTTLPTSLVSCNATGRAILWAIKQESKHKNKSTLGQCDVAQCGV